MRIRRKLFFLTKTALVISVVITIFMLLWRNDSSIEMTQTGNVGALKYVFPSMLESSGISNLVSSGAQSCLSSVDKIIVTANYTLNDILDRVKLSLGIGYIKAVEDSARAQLTSVAKTEIPDSEPLEIIVLPHSHNDPGWKKTYQKYFDDQTTHILTNIVEKLHQYPDMTFIWVESCFLDKWWSNQTSEIKERFKELVKSGRLEITSGMWVAPDEASTHYFALIDQMIEGHYWVKKNLGVVPESSLNFDQFGYSATMPYLAKKAGLKNVLIKRIHRGLKDMFGLQHRLNFKWRQFWDSKGSQDIFAHIDTYEWMSISDSCGPDRAVCRGLDFMYMPDLPIPGSPQAEKPIITDHVSRQTAPNFHEYVRRLVEQFHLKTDNYKYKVMMLPHGGDFRFDTANEWDRQYKNLKIFMDYVNEKKKIFNVHMRFGTLKDFFEEVDRQTEKYSLKYPTVSGDFYTYTENIEYWTGYFTTRQFDKRLGREVQESLRAAELFSTIIFNDKNFKLLGANVKNKMLRSLEVARKDLGVFQHHDAITGTSQAHVVIDYEKLLSSAFTSLQTVISMATEFLLTGNMPEGKIVPTLKRTGYNNLTEREPIPVTLDGTKLVLMNSLTQRRKEIVSVTLKTSDVIITDMNEQEVVTDIIKTSKGDFVAKFEVDFPPVSLMTYKLKPKGKSQSSATQNVETNTIPNKNNQYFCENELMNVTFSSKTGSTESICYKSRNHCINVDVNWRYYRGSGGAYTMISQGSESSATTQNPKITFINGRKTCGIQVDMQYFSYEMTIPLINAVIGKALRIDILSDLSKWPMFNGDLALRVDTSIKSGNVYYVDSNSFQMMGRKFRTSLPFDGNVYPMSSMAMLEDELLRLIVHSAQPHGVVSSTSGTIDFMLDRIARRSEMDMPEGVYDNKPTKTIFFIEFEKNGEFDATETTETALPSVNSLYLNDIVQHPIYKMFSLDTISIPKTSLSFLKQPLSCDIILANVKNLVDEQSNSNGASLTFFRRAVGCSNDIKKNFCPLLEVNNFNPGMLLGTDSYTRDIHVAEMTLSHLFQKSTERTDDVILTPMDLKTFHLY
ncbi:Alpha-mannosidase 2 [Mactra antiquata]